MKKILLIVFLITSLNTYAQRPSGKRPDPIKILGIVIDKETSQPLEYATLVLQRVRNPDKITGGLTDQNGKFEIEIFPGKYNIKVEYLSYNTYELKEQLLRTSTNLGTIKLGINVEQLNAIEVVGERTTVELRLDKKVYNVGQDLTVKGGSVTDVLDNVPSVIVDVEGNISLRGNESVRILINGKPSALSGFTNDALQQLPADAIEKVEVITNPSARYDAEGTAGILNIILKQNKTVGVNGSVNIFSGHPELYGAGINLNLRRDHFNIFTNTSYRYTNTPGNALFKQENFNQNGITDSFQDEIREYQRENKGFNTNIGFELFLNKTSTLTNGIVYRKSNGDDKVDIDFFNFDALKTPTIQRNRLTNESDEDETIQYSLNYKKKFNEDGHELSLDYQYSRSSEDENATINEIILNNNEIAAIEQTLTNDNQKRQLLQVDYILPFGKDNKSQLELGYRGNFNNFNTDFDFGILENNIFTSDSNFSNELNYKEYVNAAYTQLGSKFGKFNVLGGLRMEASNIGVKLINTNDNNTKNYVDWFPSLFIGYEFSDTEQLTISYSRRLRRPRSRYINPFPSRSSNTNLFQGNPDLNPTYTNAYDLGYLKRWDKITFTTSGYYNKSTGVFQFITQERGDFVAINNPTPPNEPILVPVQVLSPINLATEKRYGMEFTTSYSPKRNWRLSLNTNIFKQELRGNHSYINFLNEEITQNFDADNFTWFTRFSAKIPLPKDISFQTNLFYRGPRETAQAKNKSILVTNLAFSKDLIKDKFTASLNVSDLFNTRKRRRETKTANVFTYSEFQRRERQIRIALRYIFNQQQNEKSKNNRRNNGNGEDFDFEG